MYRLSEELAIEIMQKIKKPEFISLGPSVFTFKPNAKSVGIIDPVCATGTDFPYSLEYPSPMLYPDMPFTAPSVAGFFLYRKDELAVPQEPWEINRAMVDHSVHDYEETLDVGDCSVLLPSDIEKLTCKTIKDLNTLLKFEPTLMDCLDLEK